MKISHRFSDADFFHGGSRRFMPHVMLMAYAADRYRLGPPATEIPELLLHTGV